MDDWINTYKWEFEGYPFFTSTYIKASKKPKNGYYCQWEKGLHYFKNGYLVIYAPSQPFDKVGDKIIRELIDGNRGFLDELIKVHNEVITAMESCIRAREQDNFLDLDSWWPAAQNAHSDTAAQIYNFDYSLDKFFIKLGDNNPSLLEKINKNIVPDTPSFMTLAGNRLLDLQKQYPQDFHKVYEQFKSEFGWFQNSYNGIYHFDEAWLKNYINTLEYQQINPRNQIENGLVNYKYLIDCATRAFAYRDDRKKMILIAFELMEKWLKNVCRQNSWDWEVMRWLSVDEVIESENNPELVRKAEKYAKDKLRCGIMIPSGFQDFPLEDYYKIAELSNTTEIESIQGVPASEGNYTGIVKIILDSKEEAFKLEQGDILVTSMTRPEFLPLMGRAAAFVTDEGGITNHAAIVAREMKKPCITGTKIATRILKDGDLIEVNGNEGTIKILKKGK